MGNAYLIILKRVMVLAAVAASMWTVDAPLSVAGDSGPDASLYRNSQQNNEGAFGETAALPRPALAVGPGRVSFELTPYGRWLGLTPNWTDGRSVITRGGFVVLAVGQDGAVEELANTYNGAANRLRAREEARGLRAVHEGVAGGARFPLPERDDDGDGRENEDRLDGVDNDGDGRIDEDFAAVGDEMITASYEALGDEGEPVLLFQQECYAWTLPHIDGMVAMKLVVRNVADRTWRNVRVGAVIGQRDEFSVSTQDLTSAARDHERLASKGILLSEIGGTEATRPIVAAIFFAKPAGETASWLTGVANSDRRLADLIQTYIVTEQHPDTETAPQRGGGVGGAVRAPNPTSAAPGDDDAGSPQERIAYGMSPNLGTLAPGDEVVVYTALVAVPHIDRIDRAIEDAYRTVIGDGIHRMVPPPVSVKRWTLWGTYRTEREAASGAPTGVAIKLENARGRGIGEGDISYISGIDLTSAEVVETVGGDLELSIKGELYKEVAETRGRVDLHGRLKNGEFFDIVLRPLDDGVRSERLSGMSESQYWSLPGRLDDALLTGSPNPFRESTTIYYEVPATLSDEDGSVLNFLNPIETSVKIYNVAGRLVSILVDTIVTPGRYNTQWDGVDDNGSGVASGVYYVKLQIGKKHVTKRLIQLK